MTTLRPCFPYLLTLALLLLLAGSAFAGAEGSWQFLKAEEGIQVWKLEIPGQDLPGFRGQTVIHGSIDDVMETKLSALAAQDLPYRTLSKLRERVEASH